MCTTSWPIKVPANHVVLLSCSVVVEETAVPCPVENINLGIVKGPGFILCDDDLLSDHKQY